MQFIFVVHLCVIPFVLLSYFLIYVATINRSQRDRDAACVSFGQKWKTGTGIQYFSDIIDLSLTAVT